MADEVITITPEMQAAIAEAKKVRHYQGRPIDTPDAVRQPKHYTSQFEALCGRREIEAWDVIECILSSYDDPILAYQLGNTLKYIIRAPLKKDQAEDLSKADRYLRRAANRAAVAKPKVNRG